MMKLEGPTRVTLPCSASLFHLSRRVLMKTGTIGVLTVFLAACGVSAADSYPKGLPQSAEFFPLAVWLQSPANAERYKTIGINTFVGLWEGPTEAKLDALDKAGIRVICGYDERSSRFKDRSTIVAWMHDDEPDNAQSLGESKGYGPPITPAKIIQGYEAIRKADPDRPVLLNLGQGVAWDGWFGRGVRTNHPEDYREYLKGCDIASFDIYPASHENPEIAGNLGYVPRGVDRLRQWSGDEKDVWCCIETTRINNPDRKPTPEQVRSEVWMALIHGAKGIIYFAHEFKPKFIEAGLLADDAMARAVADINTRIRELAPALNAPDVKDGATVVSSDEKMPVDFVVKQSGEHAYLFSVSMTDGESTATFALPGGGDAQVEVLGEGRTIEAVGGKWNDHFTGYQVHLYKIFSKERK
jgi:hypothetical protein